MSMKVLVNYLNFLYELEEDLRIKVEETKNWQYILEQEIKKTSEQTKKEQ